MKKTFLLFDADHTLLDFVATEENALTQAFADSNIPFSTEMRCWYLAHNAKLWSAYEQGTIPREEIFRRRFEETFQAFSIDASGTAMEERYRQYLALGCDLIPDALSVIQALSQSYALYILTNGVAATQERRLKDSGLRPYFRDVFVSEEVGAQKPRLDYFTYCFDRIPDFQKAEAILIGDSLFADIGGGNHAGIDTCWFNPYGQKNETGIVPTLEIGSLKELLTLFL